MKEMSAMMLWLNTYLENLELNNKIFFKERNGLE